jgi:uncharacterized protein (DUF2249 family)
MISGDTTVARLLDEHPALLDFLVTYHEHFARLRDEALRTMMAPRVTVSEAARMAGVDPGELLHALRRAAGEPDDASAGAGDAAAAAPQPMPIALAALPAERRVDLDLREDIRRGEEPFARIMAAVKRLGEDEALVIRTPFEPIPLYDVLGKRGLAHWTETRAADDCAVWFYRAAVARMADVCPAMTDEPAAEAPAPRTVTLDVRGLEPPLPMVLVLERLEALRAGEQLEIFHDRRPMFLYPQLESRGFVHETEESEGLVRIRVRHGARAGA